MSKQKVQNVMKDQQTRSRIVVTLDTPRTKIPVYDWLWAVKVKIGVNNYLAQISPGKKSFINPERVQIDEINNVPTTILNTTKNICYIRDTTIATPVVLGEDAVTTFALSAFIGDMQTLPYTNNEYSESDSDEVTYEQKPHPNRRLEVAK